MTTSSTASKSTFGKGRLAIGKRSGVAISYDYEAGKKVGSVVGTIRGNLTRFHRATFNSPMILTCEDRLQFEISVTTFSSQCATFVGLPMPRQRSALEQIRRKISIDLNFADYDA